MWIRDLEKNDINDILSLERMCFSDAWSEKMICDLLSSDIDAVYVLEHENKIIGYINARVVAGEGEIMRVAVASGHREKGYGKLLMDRAMYFFKGRKVAESTLEVRSANVAARALYESYGYRQEAVREHYYHNPDDDAIIYWKRK